MDFSDKVFYYRKKYGLTMEEVATGAQTTKMSVCRWEHGESVPDIYTAVRLANMFGTTCENLCNGKNPEDSNEHQPK